ncbi:MAG: hypothetical protein LUC91_03700 [Prevotella sp.]|nr:hypothetical protein [Prevotella sp.]
MTALVGVLNRHAVAIAADSAVTMGNIHKVVNSANKIFTLSKYHPVAVMTYNNAVFMGVPLDIIIKEYRKQLEDKCFPCVKDYMNDFISFLHARNFFCDERTQQDVMISLLDSFVNACRNEILRDKGIEIPRQTEEIIEEKLNACLLSNKSADKCPEFTSYSYQDFNNYAKVRIENYAKNKSIKNSNLLSESFFYFLSAKFSQPFYTGLVFVGYGESEIYPSLFPINVCLGIDNHLKYYLDENNVAQITEHGTPAIIIPFAQIDVTQTIIRGINPSFQDIIYNVIDKSITAFSASITSILDTTPSTSLVSEAVKRLNLKSIINDITTQINKEMRETYTNPLLNTVISLDKEDMANMAESFISLTSLVRRMQPGEETVGGPVDVAVISKGDGFVWINRKYYFKPELNPSFFSNYFK